MVNINFTLVIELILFLVFLWGTNRIILRPTIKTIDERESLVKHNEDSTAEDLERAQELERTYAEEIGRLYRENEERFREARRAAIFERTSRVEQEMKEADAAILKYRQDAAESVQRQKSEARNIAQELADVIAERLGLGGGGR